MRASEGSWQYFGFCSEDSGPDPRRARKNTHNDTFTLTIAANYGGRWDVVQAVKSWQAAHLGKTVDALDKAILNAHLGLAYAPDADLLARTGGESRVSNFKLW